MKVKRRNALFFLKKENSLEFIFNLSSSFSKEYELEATNLSDLSTTWRFLENF